MANELTIAVEVDYQKGNSQTHEFIKEKTVTVSGTPAICGQIVSVGFAAEEAIPLGEVTVAGALMYGENLDDTNYIEIRPATGASLDYIRVGPREPFCFRFGSDVTAPYWIANTAACLVEYNLVPL